MYYRHGAYYFVDQGRRWHNLGRNYKHAMVRYADITNPAIDGTMGALMDRYLREIAPKKAPRTYHNNLHEMQRLRKAFGPMRPNDITPQDIYAYMDARGAPIAANREKSLLSHVFAYGVRWGIVNDNPCRLVKRNPERPRDRDVSDQEYTFVHSLASPVLQVAMDLVYLTGLRLGDLLRLSELENVTREGLLVRIGKTGKRVLFEWTPELREVVDRARALRGKVRGLYLLCNRGGQRYTESGFKAMWQRLMRKAMEKGLRERFTFHDLRAKAASAADNPTEFLAHDDPRTTNRIYRRAVRRVTPVQRKILDKRG
jgi:integrase